MHILRKIPGSAIIYVRNRRRTKEITELLVNEDITADFYHAGLDNAVKDLRTENGCTQKPAVKAEYGYLPRLIGLSDRKSTRLNSSHAT